MLRAVENDFRVSVCRALPGTNWLRRSGLTSVKNKGLVDVQRYFFWLQAC